MYMIFSEKFLSPSGYYSRRQVDCTLHSLILLFTIPQ